MIDVAFLALVPHRKYELPGIIMSSFVAIKLDTSVGGMITSTIHVLILVPVFFVLMKERSLRRGTLTAEAGGVTAVR